MRNIIHRMDDQSMNEFKRPPVYVVGHTQGGGASKVTNKNKFPTQLIIC